MMGLISSMFVAHILIKITQGLDGTTQRRLQEEENTNWNPPTPYKRQCTFCSKGILEHNLEDSLPGEYSSRLTCYNDSSKTFTERTPKNIPEWTIEDYERFFDRTYPNIEERLRKMELNMEKSKKQNFSEAYVANLRNQVK
jgi:hypothetical protein